MDIDYEAYIKEVDSIYNSALSYLSTIELSAHSKPCIVFDIDETILSSFHLHQSGALSTHSTYDDIIEQHLKAQAKPIPSAIHLQQKSAELGIHHFLITGRPHTSEMIKATEMNLINAGFTSWQGIYFCPQGINFSDAWQFKYKTRQDITNDGYDILMNIGDQVLDFKGGLSGREFKLPNPLYTL